MGKGKGVEGGESTGLKSEGENKEGGMPHGPVGYGVAEPDSRAAFKQPCIPSPSPPQPRSASPLWRMKCRIWNSWCVPTHPLVGPLT